MGGLRPFGTWRPPNDARMGKPYTSNSSCVFTLDEFIPLFAFALWVIDFGALLIHWFGLHPVIGLILWVIDVGALLIHWFGLHQVLGLILWVMDFGALLIHWIWTASGLWADPRVRRRWKFSLTNSGSVCLGLRACSTAKGALLFSALVICLREVGLLYLATWMVLAALCERKLNIDEDENKENDSLGNCRITKCDGCCCCYAGVLVSPGGLGCMESATCCRLEGGVSLRSSLISSPQTCPCFRIGMAPEACLVCIELQSPR